MLCCRQENQANAHSCSPLARALLACTSCLANRRQLHKLTMFTAVHTNFALLSSIQDCLVVS